MPANLVKTENIQEDEIIEINVRKQRKSYFGALKGIGSFKREDRARDRI